MQRILGAMVGLAAGDALGVPVQFEPRAARDADPVRGMRGGGTWKLEPGTWSDDTSLALCLAQSIVEKGFDPEDWGGDPSPGWTKACGPPGGRPSMSAAPRGGP